MTDASTHQPSTGEQQPFLRDATQPGYDEALQNLDPKNSAYDYDCSPNTRIACIAAVSIGGLLAVACVAWGVYIIIIEPVQLVVLSPLSPLSQDIVGLAVSFVLTICIDGMMFVHSVSLRWALFREGRLEYNTNIRLFTSAKKSGPNKWYINAVLLFCLLLSYTASSLIFCTYGPTWDGKSVYDNQAISSIALIVLGASIGGQAAVAIWCLMSPGAILTWSSNPLNNALAAMQNGVMEHGPGRCMVSVHQRHQRPCQGLSPCKTQGNIFQAQRSVRYIVVFLWLLVMPTTGWPIIVALYNRAMGIEISLKKNLSPCWKLELDWEQRFDYCGMNTLVFQMSKISNPDRVLPYISQIMLGVLFVLFIQACQTIALHCVELLVNLSRDEKTWRRASIGGQSRGTKRSNNPLKAAVLSWESMTLLASKAILHWIISQAMHPYIISDDAADGSSYGVTFFMTYSRLFVYAAMTVLLAVFATLLALRRPNGYQPAALGHLQTLVNLVDDWRTDEDGRMWWGDKTGFMMHDTSEFRHAGTSRHKETLGPIDPDARYAG